MVLGRKLYKVVEKYRFPTKRFNNRSYFSSVKVDIKSLISTFYVNISYCFDVHIKMAVFLFLIEADFDIMLTFKMLTIYVDMTQN